MKKDKISIKVGLVDYYSHFPFPFPLGEGREGMMVVKIMSQSVIKSRESAILMGVGVFVHDWKHSLVGTAGITAQNRENAGIVRLLIMLLGFPDLCLWVVPDRVH
ncbi:hypothetical protein L195_g020713 [Trifolium pratense]|uniref:Uncharacterized protein n=1 Tax=Trifolium pratense TaxID=57577 RepID=A0A2K3N3B3_TRIPR|nr:hypothetical protein L195_g020713 [Trifolium pratense]